MLIQTPPSFTVRLRMAFRDSPVTTLSLEPRPVDFNGHRVGAPLPPHLLGAPRRPDEGEPEHGI
jgi:hypothetical protein